MRIKRKSAWSSLLACVSLFLIAHAFLVSATHHHLAGLEDSVHPAYAPAAGESREESRESREAGGEAQCLFCRLQRHFISDANPPPAFAPDPAQELAASTLLARLRSRDLYLALPPRAPPKL